MFCCRLKSLAKIGVKHLFQIIAAVIFFVLKKGEGALVEYAQPGFNPVPLNSLLVGGHLRASTCLQWPVIFAGCRC